MIWYFQNAKTWRNHWKINLSIFKIDYLKNISSTLLGAGDLGVRSLLFSFRVYSLSKVSGNLLYFNLVLFSFSVSFSFLTLYKLLEILMIIWITKSQD